MTDRQLTSFDEPVEDKTNVLGLCYAVIVIIIFLLICLTIWILYWLLT